MSDCSDHKNPLQHSGTSQPQRLLPGMDKNKYALADEKEYADWIVFAGEFARYIKYYSTDDVFTKNWQLFFTHDISAQLGAIAIQDIERYRTEIKERLDYIRDDDNESSIDAVELKLNELFSAILTLSKALDEAQLKLPPETSLKATILNLIQTKLAPALKIFIAYYYAAADHGYLNHSFLSPWKILNKPLTDANDIITSEGLSNAWLFETDKVNWNDYTGTFPPKGDDSIFNDPLNGLTGFADDYLSIVHAANHNLFTGLFDIYLTTYTKIIREAESELLKSLESYDSHTAHYALFLTFLKLFRFAQNHINTLTQRHLDFYYREVLKLQPRPAQANKVHVTGELAKQVDAYLLAAGTALKAGKDSLNNDVIYKLDADAVLNKAKVAQLRTFYKGNKDENVLIPGTTTVKQYNEGRVFASPVTNSDDGLGAELTSPQKEWQPYVHKVFAEAELQSIAMPKARLGFALASHYLYLTEGDRKVFIRFVTNSPSALIGKHIECWLTAEKEWYQVAATDISVAPGKLSEDDINCTEIALTIPGSAPAIVNYNASVHGGTFNLALPVLKIYLKQDDLVAYEYDLLKDVKVSKIEIRVEVGMGSGYNQKGLKNLLLSSDFGALDASKPFMPFGTAPTAGNRLVIGSKEIFSKKKITVNLNLEWKDIPATRSSVSFETLGGDGNYPNVKLKKLHEGIWKDVGSDTELFENQGTSEVKNQKQISTSGNNLDNAIVDFADDYLPYSLSTSKGFIAIQLTEGFGHKNYLTTLTDYFIRKGNRVPGDDIDMPAEPYTPTLQSVYAGYSAYSINEITNASTFGSRDIRLFHLYPFGEGEQHKYLQPGTDVYLLPQFKQAVNSSPQPHSGEFYIGIEKLEPGEAVNILFQVLEGTTDPELVKPQEHIDWSYLGNNQWIAFEQSEYSDNTNGLVQSGIISFAVPKGATTENTILPTGFIWIRAAVIEAAEAVCKLLSVEAQAAVATFSDNQNAEDFLNNPLAAGTISKLKIPDAAVRKIVQPYPSFGGRQKENDDHFYIRVSERLRHKARAITVWDYEHLVLEAFPEIYKVKCLNHTQIEGLIYNEVKPGHVSIITIPSLQNRNDANPLKPFTQQSTLTNIENFLKKKVSCFVNLHARQPQFEEVRMEFSLKLYDQYKDFTFYSTKLKEEITQFLSPWAYGNPTSLDFGGKVYKSVLINFIEEKYYVDFITDVFMFVKTSDETPSSADLDEITASTARSILVSAPASKHVIHEFTAAPASVADPCFDTEVKPDENHKTN
jgi:hypothetical protein